ncbi:MAG: hypothetical protein IKO05_03020 [Selenomonadaceae bacterium]|nr:hypothetical protein [Selenomonadaceae bacterium]
MSKQIPVVVDNINPYLLPGPDIMVAPRTKPFFRVPEMIMGSMMAEDGNFKFTPEELENFLKAEPAAKKWIRPLIGSDDFIKGKKRFCLWLKDCPPDELRKMPRVYERVKNVREYRLASKRAATRKLADKPTLFAEIRQPTTDFILIPKVSSERRRYIPIGFMSADNIVVNTALMIPDADLFHFGILTSSVHMNWMRLVGGRLKSDYQYSATICYNPFPWPLFYPDTYKARIEATAQKILDARKNYPRATFADLYDEISMPSDLRRAHAENDAAVMKLYHFPPDMDEPAMKIQLLYMYQALLEHFGEDEEEE